MSRGGFSFGNFPLYQMRMYYGQWIKRTLLSARRLPISQRDKHSILTMLENLQPPPIEDPGRLPCASLQKDGGLSRRDDKTICLLVMIRDLIQMWWGCGEESPQHVEDSLVKLDAVIEDWERIIVIGSIGAGFKLEILL